MTMEKAMNAVVKPKLTIRQEHYSEAFLIEAKPLTEAHWREIANHQDEIPLDLDHPRYLQLERMGKILILTARADGRLVGYCSWLIGPGLHYRSSLFAHNDVIYIDPEYRKGRLGVKLILESERLLRERGVKRMSWHAKACNSFPALLERLGYPALETTHIKVL